MAINPYSGGNLGFGNYTPGQNPYLQQNVGIAQNDIVKNYQTAIAPRQASMNAAGGSFGNSGLQQVQLEDQRQLQQNLGNVASTMYGNAYNTDQANNLAFTNANNQNTTALGVAGIGAEASRYGADASTRNANIGAGASMYGSDASREASMYGSNLGLAGQMYGADSNVNIAGMNNATSARNTDVNAAANRYGSDRSAYASMYGSDRSANASMYSANQNRAAQRYSSDQSRAGQQYSADASAGASRYGSDQSRAGQEYSADASAGASRYGSDQSLAGQQYSADSGLTGQKYASDASAGASRYGSDQSRAGQQYSADQSLSGQRYASSNNLIGQKYASDASAGASRYGSDQALKGQQYSTDANYDLGLRNNDLGYDRLGMDVYNSNFNNQLAGANFGMNIYDRIAAGDASAVADGTTIQNAPLSYEQFITNMQNSVGNGYSNTTTTGTNSTAANVAGGAVMANRIYENTNLGFGGSPGSGDWVNGTGNYAQYVNPDYGQFF